MRAASDHAIKGLDYLVQRDTSRSRNGAGTGWVELVQYSDGCFEDCSKAERIRRAKETTKASRAAFVIVELRVSEMRMIEHINYLVTASMTYPGSRASRTRANPSVSL